ncbi:hypothetical protein C5F49_02715 [Nitrosopumilus oxyclinae]|uniref:DM13 domain-containing protein n=1 Tax=Nitrosopumilus oxyclinae TaxID=1959104 RepID=A0A7D5M485_9ARCH|nr:DM13 domain-containing protein [Nitrosopumilus oxyclinae]QLH04347.1 hypothetical protein C5F49_02715 [Nitrosopumilus oxyclinae]
MNKSILVIVAIVVVGGVTVFATYPYFTESTVDEAIPAGAITQPMMEDKDAMLMKDDSTRMEDKMMEEESIETPPISYAGTFIGVGDGIHDAQGDAYTIPLENESTILRLENFESTNGPDLFVYLATDDKASDFVNLGDLKANRGNQNYEIPNGTDLSKYNKVLIWCKAFGVLFGSAELSS